MEQINDAIAMLELMPRGAFCVQDGIITGTNESARKHAITVGKPVRDILLTGKDEYAQFQNGCLYLTLNLSGISCGASVSCVNGIHIFLLEQTDDQADLQVMALAAQELRQPLTNIMTVADRLFPLKGEEKDPQMQDQVSRINRGLYQMLRIISNMSDAYRYTQDTTAFHSMRDIGSILDEVFLSAAPLIANTGVKLNYTGLQESIYCLVDAEKLERAVSNILSNALKFASKDGVIDAHLTRKGHMLYLTVQDNGSGISESMRGNVYTLFRREPGIEDSRFGIGLGMVLIRSAAAAHGGTVLIEQTPEKGTRLTMSLAIRQDSGSMVRSPMLHVDYAGERDHRLLEFSDSLPADLYHK